VYLQVVFLDHLVENTLDPLTTPRINLYTSDLIADLIMVPKGSPGPKKKRRKVSICCYCVERQFIFCSSHFIFCCTFQTQKMIKTTSSVMKDLATLNVRTFFYYSSKC
jgi:hypothetical protein